MPSAKKINGGVAMCSWHLANGNQWRNGEMKMAWHQLAANQW